MMMLSLRRILKSCTNKLCAKEASWMYQLRDQKYHLLLLLLQHELPQLLCPKVQARLAQQTLVTLAPAPELDGDSTVVPQPTPWRIQKSRLPF